MVEYYDESVDVKRKRKPSWYSAFYYFAEAVKELTSGEVNYKVLWSLAGTNGNYINHANPTLRASLAPEFSRLIHSSRYADDLKKSYHINKVVFDSAADTLYSIFYNTSDMDDDVMFRVLSTTMYQDILIGLANEMGYGRPELDLARVRRETEMLFDWYYRAPESKKSTWNRKIIASYFHILAFDYLPSELIHDLSGETPLVDRGRTKAVTSQSACLIRTYSKDVLGGIWELNPQKVTTIGRYTDCDISDVDEYVSRHHANVFSENGAWYVEDTNSTHGTQVRHKDTVVMLGALNPEGVCKSEVCANDTIILTKGTSFVLMPFKKA